VLFAALGQANSPQSSPSPFPLSVKLLKHEHGSSLSATRGREHRRRHRLFFSLSRPFRFSRSIANHFLQLSRWRAFFPPFLPGLQTTTLVFPLTFGAGPHVETFPSVKSFAIFFLVGLAMLAFFFSKFHLLMAGHIKLPALRQRVAFFFRKFPRGSSLPRADTFRNRRPTRLLQGCRDAFFSFFVGPQENRITFASLFWCPIDLRSSLTGMIAQRNAFFFFFAPFSPLCGCGPQSDLNPDSRGLVGLVGFPGPPQPP